MAIRTYKVTLDSKNSIAPEPVFLRQGDKTGAVVINATLMDNGSPVSLSGLTPMFKANTADGQAVIADSTGFNIVNASGGEFTYQVPSQLGSVPGKIKIAYFSFSDSSGSQSTFNVVFVVEKAADMTQESAKDWISTLSDIIGKYNQWSNDAHSSWEQFVNDNKAIIESIDPGGKVISELIDFRHSDMLKKTFDTAKLRGDFFDKEFADRGVNVKWFGAKGDGTADDTAAIQAAIDYAAPFDWKGDITSTITASGDAKSAVYLPAGNYLITKPIMLNPNVIVSGNSSVSFFQSGKTTTIIADFDELKGGIFDSAPYNANGVRVVGWYASRDDWDKRLSTGCHGWTLKNINITVSKNHTVAIGVNRSVSPQSKISGVSIDPGEGNIYVGIRNCVMWGGAIRDCHIVATLYGIYNGNDTTIDMQENNYLTGSGRTIPTQLEYEHNAYPDPNLIEKSAGIFNYYANANGISNVVENFDIGVAIATGSSFNDYGGYYEKMNELVYAVNSASAKLEPSWILAANASIFNVALSTVGLDLSAVNILKYKESGHSDNYSAVTVFGVVLKGSYCKTVKFDNLQNANTVAIYVDSNGIDTNIGYSKENPVQTLTEAFNRLISGKNNQIILKSGDTIMTKSWVDNVHPFNIYYDDGMIDIVGNNATISVASSDITNSIVNGSSGVRIKDVTISLGSSADNYKPFLIGSNGRKFELNNVIVNGQDGSFLFGTVWGKPANLSITMNDVALNNTHFIHDGGDSKLLAWTEIGTNVRLSNSNVGVTSGRIYSTTFN